MKKTAAVLLIVILLLASVSLSEGILPGDWAEGSRLIGLLITREDLSVYTGGAGGLPASCVQAGPDSDPEYLFGDVRGLRLICFAVPDEAGEGSRVVSNVDDGFTAVDFDISEDSGSVNMDAAFCFVPGPEDALFFFNPVLLSASGQAAAVPGDYMSVSAEMNPPGSSVGQTVRDERRHLENGREIVDVTTVTVQIDAVREPAEIRLLQFDENHVLLKSEAFTPSSVPEQIRPLAETAYLLLETVEKDGKGGFLIRREAAGRDQDYLITMSCAEDGICLCHGHEIIWE